MVELLFLFFILLLELHCFETYLSSFLSAFLHIFHVFLMLESYDFLLHVQRFFGLRFKFSVDFINDTVLTGVTSSLKLSFLSPAFSHMVRASWHVTKTANLYLKYHFFILTLSSSFPQTTQLLLSSR